MSTQGIVRVDIGDRSCRHRVTGCADGPLGTGRFGNYPYGMAIDTSGYLYVADNQCGVRRVAPNGVISTLAGGINPVGIAVGPAQNGQ